MGSRLSIGRYLCDERCVANFRAIVWMTTFKDSCEMQPTFNICNVLNDCHLELALANNYVH